MRLIICAVLLAWAAPSRAIMPSALAKDDAKRFSLNKPERRSTITRVQAAAAMTQFNRRHGGINPAGVLRPHAAHQAKPGDAAKVFLSESEAALGLDSSALTLESETSGRGHHHALFKETYRGLSVEFARVKVHMDDNGAVTDFNSNFEDIKNLDITPQIEKAQAMRSAAAHAKISKAQSASLVVFPDLYGSSPARLAWKVSLRGKDALWRYYIDAKTGEVLFRYNDLSMAGSCTYPVQGTVYGPIYDIDPNTTPSYHEKPFIHERISVGDGSVANSTTTLEDGTYCAANSGKISTQLQGQFVSVANYRGASAHYDNGQGIWTAVQSSISSPHPYPNDAVLISTIDLTSLQSLGNPPIFSVIPVFSQLNVGGLSQPGFTNGESADITDDDTLFIVDPFGNPVAGYVGDMTGNFGVFHAAAVPGPVVRIQLQSNSAGQNYGYDVAVSSYLTLNDPGTVCGGLGDPCQDVHWSTGANTSLPLHSEFNLFYHLNLMHDYFGGIMGASSATFLSGSVNAMSLVGPGLVNAFYNPDTDNLFFGDTCGSAAPGDCFSDDATVPHHEYTHFVVEKIWHIQNFGQAGAISEADADYFSASSFSSPLFGGYSVDGVGAYVDGAFGTSLPLREADWQSAVSDTCGSQAGIMDVLSNASWQGEIHCDDRFILQALWDIRKAAIASPGIGAVNGPICVNGLVFQALLFFPESFAEYEQALLQADAVGAVSACGSAGVMNTFIASAFANHGIGAVNGTTAGFETAIDVSTMPSTTGTIATPAQVNFYTFAAGRGPLSIAMTLPQASAGPGFYSAYTMTLFDVNHNIVAEAAPPYNGVHTTDGFCGDPQDMTDCTTTQKTVVLTYQKPKGGQLFLEIQGGLFTNSNSAVHNASPYTLQFVYNQSSAFVGSVVAAKMDHDAIDFTVHVTSYAHLQDYSFAFAQLRDQARNVLPNTLTSVPNSYLVVSASENALGQITGTVNIASSAVGAVYETFSQRFPAAGTIYLEVFGYNVIGSTISLGLSNPINVTGSGADLHAWNNVFNPAAGQKATVKYSLSSPGHLTMKLYTLNGTLVETLFDGEVPAGEGSVDWQGKNFAGHTVASGLYLLHAVGPGLSKTVKLAVVK